MASTMGHQESPDEASAEKRPRKRLKKLMQDICQQVEFYFSDANLRKDRFLQQEILKSDKGYVSVDIIASFNKMRSLSEDRKTIVAAIQQSVSLELSPNKASLRRRQALRPPKFDPDDCTVYVECLPKKVDHAWLQRAFSCCGSVVYVSLPRYKSTGDIKGFAFIEFETPDGAERACEVMHNPPPDFRDRAGKFPKMRGRRRIVPAEFDLRESQSEHVPRQNLAGRTQVLSSHKMEENSTGKAIFKKPTEKEGMPLGENQSKTDAKKMKEVQKRKRQLSDSSRHDPEEGSDSIVPAKSSKTLQQRDQNKVPAGKERAVGGKSEVATEGKQRTQHDESTEGAQKTAEGRSSGNETGGELSSLERQEQIVALVRKKMMKRKRSLSEGDLWKLQGDHDDEEEEVVSLKKAKREESEEKAHGSSKDDSFRSDVEKKKRGRKKKLKRLQEEEETLFLRVLPKREWLDLKQEYLALQKESLALMKESLRPQPTTALPPFRATSSTQPQQTTGAGKDQVESRPDQVTTAVSTPSDMEVIPGTVLSLNASDSDLARKEIRDHLEKISPVAYVDLPDGERQGYVRFHSAEGARAVLQPDRLDELSQHQISLSLVTGDDETAYWEKLKLDRHNKLHSKQKKKKKRGINKILQKAERAQSAREKAHIRFDS